MLSESEFNLLSQLFKRKSMQSLALINGDYELADFQTFAVAYAYIRKKMFISLDTGLGKTLVASTLINLDCTNSNWLFICKNSNLLQTYHKLQTLIRKKEIFKSTAKTEDIIKLLKTVDDNKVVLLTYNCFESLEIQNYIFNHRASYKGIIIDESHSIGNIGSNRSEMLKHLMRNCFEYQYLLTATPLSVDPLQILNQINMIDQDLVPDPESLALRYTVRIDGNKVGYKNLDVLSEKIEERYITLTRKELGLRGDYKPILRLVSPPTGYDYDTLRKVNTIKEIKQSCNNNALLELKRILREYKEQDKKGLIYANLEVYKSLIIDSCEEFRIELLDGSKNNVEKQDIQDRFNNDEIDFLVCNLLEGVDLPCDFIVFYEMTVLTKQFIGRGERGLSGKDLDIYFIVIANSYDITYFYKNVFKRSLILEELCKKDVDEIKAISKQLMNNLYDEEDIEDYQIIKKYMLDDE